MRKHFLLVCLFFSNLTLLAQVEAWVARYNGSGNGPDVALAIAHDDKGNVYVTGGSTGLGPGWKFATIKYDRNGDEVWVARYKGPGNGNDVARAIAVDDEGNVYVTGYSWGGPTHFDYATVKYDTQGNEVWVARYNGPGNHEDSATAIALDSEGNIYVTGYSNGGPETRLDFATIKYDRAGNEVWVVRYNGPGNGDDDAWGLVLDAEKNVYVTGHSAGISSGLDYATIKYDPKGNEAWVARYNGPGNGNDIARAIALDAKGNAYVTGAVWGGSTIGDSCTIKYDSEGNEMWVAIYDGPAHGDDDSEALAVDAEGNVYMTGRSFGIGTSYDWATIKYSTDGMELWVARYDGPISGRDEPGGLALDRKGNVYVTGMSSTRPSADGYEYTTVGYDPNGNELWVATYRGPGNAGDRATAITVSAEGDVCVTGFSAGNRGWSDYATIKYTRDY